MRPAIIKAYSLGIVTGGFLAAALIAAIPAKADPDQVSLMYAERYGGAVCATLDDYPSFDGILGIGEAIVEDGLSYTQAGYVIAISVGDYCPRHTSLVMAFSRHYDNQVVA